MKKMNTKSVIVEYVFNFNKTPEENRLEYIKLCIDAYGKPHYSEEEWKAYIEY